MADATPRTPFDAGKYITKVSGRDYLEVKWRLVWLRTEHPEATIETELMQHERDSAIFRARVEIEHSPGVLASATGWGSETAADFGDYIEKAETKALGRALAALGFGTQFCEDFDFGAARGRVVDSPIDIRGAREQPYSVRGAAREEQQARQAQPPPGQTGQEATPRQLQYLAAVAREAGFAEQDIDLRAQTAFGHGVAHLSRREASTLIEQLQAERTVD